MSAVTIIYTPAACYTTVRGNPVDPSKVNGMQSVRTIGSRNTCDGWAFNADSPITLIAFNYAQSGIMQQHNRWFTVMELSIPKPPGALAGFRTEKVTPVEANQPAPDTRSEEAKYNDWMEFMG